MSASSPAEPPPQAEPTSSTTSPSTEPPSQADKQANAKLASGVGLVSGATLASGLLNIALLMSLTRLLSKADFGVISFAYMLFGLVSVVGALGLPSALLFYTTRLSAARQRALARHVGALLLGLGALLGGALAHWGELALSDAQRPLIAPLLPIIGLALIGDLPGQTLPSYLLALERYGASALATLGFALTRFVGLVLPAFMGWGVRAMAWGLALTALTRGALLLLFVWRPTSRTSQAEQGTREGRVDLTWSTRELLAYGLPLSLSAVVGKLNVQADKYLIAALTSAEVYAIYHVGALELPLVYGVAYSVTNALTPSLITRYHNQDREGFLQLWHSSVRKVAALIMPIAVYLMIFAEEVITLAFSERYAQAALPFRVYLCLLPLRLCSYGAVVRATGLTRPVFVATTLSLVSNLALNYPLYQLFGLAGPALASIIAQVVAIYLLLRVTKRQLSVSWGRVFPFLELLKTLSLAALVGLTTLGLLHLLSVMGAPLIASALNTKPFTLTLGGLILMPLYLWLGERVGVLSGADLRYARDALTLKKLRMKLKH